MPNDVTITIAGNLTGDPELKVTPSGQPVANFTIAHTPRYRDAGTGEWHDGETWFLRCAAWRDLADNVCGSLGKGHAVLATGRLRARTWETDAGDKRATVELTVDDIGPSLRRATAKVVKTTRERTADRADGTGAPADPWTTPPATTVPANGTAASGGFTDEPPF